MTFHALVVYDIVVVANLFEHGDLIHLAFQGVDMRLCFECVVVHDVSPY